MATTSTSLSARAFGHDPSRPPVVVLPGLAVSRYLHAGCSSLAERTGRRVLLVEPPGFGANARALPGPVTVARVADALVPWLATLGPVLLVGQSTGCLLAARMARSSLGLDVEAVALVSPVFDPARASLPSAAGRLLLDGRNEPWWLAPVEAPEWARNARGLPGYLLSCLREPLDEHLDDVRCPVVVTRGERDSLSRHEWAASLTDRPHRTLVTVPGGGHTYMAADPAALPDSLAGGHFAASEGSSS
jgi:pimeloyl-ACP methyl ester carboxylesterase